MPAAALLMVEVVPTFGDQVYVNGLRPEVGLTVMLPVAVPAQAGGLVAVVTVMGAIVNGKQRGGATLPQRSVTEPTAVPRQKE